MPADAVYAVPQSASGSGPAAGTVGRVACSATEAAFADSVADTHFAPGRLTIAPLPCEVSMSHSNDGFSILWANLGPPSYLVVSPPKVAPYYPAISGACLTIAVVLFGLWLLRHRTVGNLNARLCLWVSAGVLSFAWVSEWIRGYDGKGLVKGTDYWDIALDLPTIWVVILSVLIVIKLAAFLLEGAAPATRRFWGYATISGVFVIGVLLAFPLAASISAAIGIVLLAVHVRGGGFHDSSY